jgi:membrane-associated phospholipid phosphatase
MPFLVLIMCSLSAGAAVFLAASWYPTAAGGAPPVTAATGRQLAKEAVRHPWFARLLRSRLDPQTATGLALTLALGVAVIGGVVLGSLAYLMRTSGALVEIDASVGGWGADHASDGSTRLLQFVTDLASTPVTISVLAVVVVIELVRLPNRWMVPFLLTVVVGEVVLVRITKQILDRVRPTFNPIAETLGPSFPSGHSATAAALYAGVALVLARRRPPVLRAMLAATAAGVAVAVACSRVMLVSIGYRTPLPA